MILEKEWAIETNNRFAISTEKKEEITQFSL